MCDDAWVLDISFLYADTNMTANVAAYPDPQ